MNLNKHQKAATEIFFVSHLNLVDNCYQVTIYRNIYNKLSFFKHSVKTYTSI